MAARWARALRAARSPRLCRGPGSAAAELPLLGAAELHSARGMERRPRPPVPGERRGSSPRRRGRTAGGDRRWSCEGEQIPYRRARQQAERLACRPGGARGGKPTARRSLAVLCRALAGAGRGILAHPQGRRRLRAARSRLPAERLAYMLERRGPIARRSRDGRRWRRLRRTATGRRPRQPRTHRAPTPSPALPERLAAAPTAYVIYTSGSTGRPKGVWSPTRNVVRLFDGHRALVRLRPDGCLDAVPLATPSTSRSGRSGARCSTAAGWWSSRTGSAARPTTSYELLRRGAGHGPQPDAVGLPPARSRRGPAAPAPSRAPLRWVIFGGEALESGALRAVVATATATTARGWSTCTASPRPRCTSPTARSAAPIRGRVAGACIGRPIPDLRALRPRPRRRSRCRSGVPGEMYVGGAGVARGYLGRPELTAERFVPDPLGGCRERGSTAPATWRAGGRTATLEYLGRIDHQVKIRGFRIELGRDRGGRSPRHPAVREAVVLAREDAPGDKRLVAYLVRAATRRSGRGAARLPQASGCPTTWCRRPSWSLAALPLTANGKVDRAGPAGARRGGRPGGAGLRGAARRRSRSGSPAILARCSGSSGSASRRLLRPRRPLAPRHAGVARLRAAFGVELPLRAPLRGARPSAELAAAVDAAREDGLRPRRPRRLAPLAPAPPASTAALVRPAAPLVPRPARAGRARPTTSRWRCASTGRSRPARCSPRPRRDRAPPRGAAHHLRVADGGRPVQRSCPAAGRARCRSSTSRACPPSRRQDAAAVVARREAPPPVRSRPRTAAPARRPVPARRARAPASR